mgnify:FL=1
MILTNNTLKVLIILTLLLLLGIMIMNNYKYTETFITNDMTNDSFPIFVGRPYQMTNVKYLKVEGSNIKISDNKDDNTNPVTILRQDGMPYVIDKILKVYPTDDNNYKILKVKLQSNVVHYLFKISPQLSTKYSLTPINGSLSFGKNEFMFLNDNSFVDATIYNFNDIINYSRHYPGQPQNSKLYLHGYKYEEREYLIIVNPEQLYIRYTDTDKKLREHINLKSTNTNSSSNISKSIMDIYVDYENPPINDGVPMPKVYLLTEELLDKPESCDAAFIQNEILRNKLKTEEEGEEETETETEEEEETETETEEMTAPAKAKAAERAGSSPSAAPAEMTLAAAAAKAKMTRRIDGARTVAAAAAERTGSPWDFSDSDTE